MRLVLIVLLVVVATPALAAKKPSREQVHQRAMNAYQALDFKLAADLFTKEIGMLKPAELGSRVELEARVRLVLSLFQAGKKPESIDEYKRLKAKFQAFQFDDNEVLPETIEFFDQAVPSAAPKPEPDPVPAPVVAPPKPEPPPVKTNEPKPVDNTPKQIVVAPDSQRVVTAPATVPAAVTKRWHWYYLTPLGIGQFLAGSPVRGVIFSVLQTGLVAANVALYVMFNRMCRTVGNECQAANPQATQNMQYALNTVFFSMIGSFVAGIIDGALEP